jgi:hypothetical protein
MRLVRLSSALLTITAVTASLPATAAPEWDLLGVKLGMTEAEVRAAFQAYDPKAKVTATQASLTYNDGVSAHRTPPFLDMIQIEVQRVSRFFPLRVWFSGPVGEPRVIAIARRETNTPNPPTKAQFVQAIEAKYGAPTRRYGTGPNAMPIWEESDKPSCAKSRAIAGETALGEFPQVVTGQVNLSRALTNFMNRAEFELNNPPADLSKCAAVMYYTVNLDPVTSFDAGLFDLGALAATAKSRQEYVEKLQAEARAKRENKGAVPQL